MRRETLVEYPVGAHAMRPFERALVLLERDLGGRA